MKQAWGWLIAAVMAAGLNAIYHDGGLQMVHRVVARAGYNVEAVLALASGQADRFLTEARLASAQDEAASCRFSAALARFQSRFARQQGNFARFEAMSARQEAQLARFEAHRARIEAEMARVRIPAMAINPVAFKAPIAPVCPRVRVNLPKMPMIKAPMVHFDLPGAGPV